MIRSLAKSLTGFSLNDGVAMTLGGVRSASRHKGMADKRKDFNVLRDYPVGPHKQLAPKVKFDGRVGECKNYRHIIHYPKDGRYTIQRLPVTKLEGKDPDTGRKVIQRVRGGYKQKARWIDWRRWPEDRDPDAPDLVEKIIRLSYDPMRKPMIVLTGHGSHLRWQVATSEMKEGDLITTSNKIPTNPVRPVAGNGYPLGALPVGTEICQVQWYYGTDVVRIINAEDNVKIIRKVGDRVVIQLQEKKRKNMYSLDQRCMCVVGVNSIHPLKKLIIGSPNRARWMGIGPRKGLWHRKTGHQGRKIRALPPVEEVREPEPSKNQKLILHCSTEGIMGAPMGRKRRFDVTKW